MSLIENGQRLPAAILSGDEDWAVRPEAIRRRVALGATLLIERVERRSPVLNALCRDLERTIGPAAGINLYLTPESSQGCHLPFDYRDVLALRQRAARCPRRSRG